MEPLPKILGESAYEPPSPVTRLTGRLTYTELEEINNRVTSAIREVLMKHRDYSPEMERETVMEMIDRLQNTPMDFGNFRMPPPKVTSVSHSEDHGYVVHVDQNLPVIPSWVEIRASYNDAAFTNGVSSQEGDNVDIQGESFVCEGTFQGEPICHEVAYKGEGIGTPMNFNSDHPIDALMDFQVAGESKLKVKPSGEITIAPGGPFFMEPWGKPIDQRYLDGPRGPVGSPGAPGQPGIPAVYPTPTLLRTSSQKPLMYSVDVYRSLKDAQYVAISSFPIVGINDGNKIKPYAVGVSVQDALNKLAESIRGFTGRKELGVINEHMYVNQWVCVHCHDVRGYPTKQELIDHIGIRHGGNLSVDKYTNPAALNTWLKLP